MLTGLGVQDALGCVSSIVTLSVTLRFMAAFPPGNWTSDCSVSCRWVLGWDSLRVGPLQHPNMLSMR